MRTTRMIFKNGRWVICNTDQFNEAIKNNIPCRLKTGSDPWQFFNYKEKSDPDPELKKPKKDPVNYTKKGSVKIWNLLE